jgi:hypothetical protein
MLPHNKKKLPPVRRELFKPKQLGKYFSGRGNAFGLA